MIADLAFPRRKDGRRGANGPTIMIDKRGHGRDITWINWN